MTDQEFSEFIEEQARKHKNEKLLPFYKYWTNRCPTDPGLYYGWAL